MTCTHFRDTSRYEEIYNDWDGTTETVWVESSESTQVDISIGAFKCTQCGEVGYYTGSWKKYYEQGTPCLGDYSVSAQERDAVRKAAKID